MIDARIRRIDVSRRTILVTTADGRELTLTLDEGANIEVHEPTTMGTMAGSLADLREGYWVQVALEEQGGDHCRCASVVCVS